MFGAHRHKGDGLVQAALPRADEIGGFLVTRLEPVDEKYFERAPQRFAHTWSIAQPAEKVWAELVSEQPLHWLRGLRLRWTSAPPFGVGTTRQGKAMGGTMTIDEHFFIW